MQLNLTKEQFRELLQELEETDQIVQLGQRGPKVRYKLRQGINL